MITSNSFRFTLLNSLHHQLHQIFQFHIVAIVHKITLLCLQVYSLPIYNQVLGVVMINYGSILTQALVTHRPLVMSQPLLTCQALFEA